MRRLNSRRLTTREVRLEPVAATCAGCGGALRADYTCQRVVRTLRGLLRLHLQVRRCHRRGCPRCGRAVRPEQEGRLALPGHAFGLDVIAFVGSQRYAHSRSVPEIHAALLGRGVVVSERTITNLLYRFDELLALNLMEDAHLQQMTAAEGSVVLALDGLQPDVGQEVLWVVRDCLSGTVLRAKCLLSATQKDLAALLLAVKRALKVPVVGVISDGQHSIQNAVRQVFPKVPYQLCHFHYLRDAAQPLYESDRSAKKELKKHVRGVRPVERAVEGRTDPLAAVIQGYCAAVRSALTDDHRPPLKPSGLLLEGRLKAIVDSLEQVEKGGRYLPN